MDIAIAALRADDIESVVALARLVWQHTYPGIISQQQIDFMLEQRYNPQRLRGELATPGIWWEQIRVDGQLAGFASALKTTSGEMKLDKLYVDPQRQRAGLGTRLLERVVEHALAEGCSTLILAVNKRNERAIAAYRKNGFHIRESVCVDIGGGFVMDDFIMTKSLITLRPGAQQQ